LPNQNGKIPSEEIRKISQDYYNCVLHDPRGYKAFIQNRTIENSRPAPILFQLRQKIGNYFSYTYADLLTIPYLLRVKIIDTLKTNYDMKESSIKAKKIQMICMIEDVIKGDEYFNISDTITISYLNSWFLCISTIKYFQVDKSYLIPVNTWYDNKSNDYCFEQTGDMCSIYPIESDTISIPSDYFDIGEKISWKDFKKQMLSYYTIIPSDTFATFIEKRNIDKIETMDCEEVERYAGLFEKNTLIDFVSETSKIINDKDTSIVKLIYPSEALKNNIEGKLLVRAIVDLSGIPRCCKILKGSLGYGCEEEAIRYVSSLRFSTGRLPKGKPTVETKIIPVKFELP